MRHITLLKLALTVPVTAALFYGLAADPAVGGVMAELAMLGPTGVTIAVFAFLGLVAIYARDLHRCLAAMAPHARTMDPRSVWLMFAIPYNFVEDFFIVHGIDKSLRRAAFDSQELLRFRSYGRISGIGWCSAQIVSLIPNFVGSVAGLIAILLWLWHWIFIRRATAALRGDPRASAMLD